MSEDSVCAPVIAAVRKDEDSGERCEMVALTVHPAGGASRFIRLGPVSSDFGAKAFWITLNEAVALAAHLLGAAKRSGANVGDAGEAFLLSKASGRKAGEALADRSRAVDDLAARVAALEKRLDDRDAAERESEEREAEWSVISKSIMNTTPAKDWLSELDRARAEFDRATAEATKAKGVATV